MAFYQSFHYANARDVLPAMQEDQRPLGLKILEAFHNNHLEMIVLTVMLRKDSGLHLDITLSDTPMPGKDYPYAIEEIDGVSQMATRGDTAKEKNTTCLQFGFCLNERELLQKQCVLNELESMIQRNTLYPVAPRPEPLH